MTRNENFYLSSEKIKEELEKIYAEREAFRKTDESRTYCDVMNSRHPKEEYFLEQIMDVLSRRNPKLIDPNSKRN